MIDAGSAKFRIEIDPTSYNQTLRDLEQKVKQLTTDLDNATKSFTNLKNGKTSFDEVNNSAKKLDDTVKKVGTSINELGQKANATYNIMDNSIVRLYSSLNVALDAKSLLKKGLDEVIETLKESTKMAIEFESALADVKKLAFDETTKNVNDKMQDLRKTTMDLAKELPVTETELAKGMATAAQVGVRGQQELKIMTEWAAKATIAMGEFNNDQGMIIEKGQQILNVWQKDIKEFPQIMNLLNTVGNNTQMNGKQAVEFLVRLNAAADLIPVDKATAFGATLKAMGLNAGNAGVLFNGAVVTMKRKAEELAPILKMTANQFRKSLAEDATGTITTLVKKLSALPKDSTFIEDTFGNYGKAIKKLATASETGLLDKYMKSMEGADQTIKSINNEVTSFLGTTANQMKIAENKAREIMIGIGDQIKEFGLAFAPIKQTLLQGLSDIISFLKPKFQPLIDFVQKDIMGLIKNWSKGIGGELGGIFSLIWKLTTPVREWTMLTIKGISSVFEFITDKINWTINAINDVGDTLGIWESKGKIDLFNTEKAAPELEHVKEVMIGMIDTLNALGQNDAAQKMTDEIVRNIENAALATDDYSKSMEVSITDAAGKSETAMITAWDSARLSAALASDDMATASDIISRNFNITSEQAQAYLKDIQNGAKIGADGVISYMANGANQSKVQLKGLATYANTVLSKIGQTIVNNAHIFQALGFNTDKMLASMTSSGKTSTSLVPTNEEEPLDIETKSEKKAAAKAQKAAAKAAKAEQKEKEKAEKEENKRHLEQQKQEYDDFLKNLENKKKEQEKYFKEIEKAGKDITSFIEQDNFKSKVDLLKAYQKIELDNTNMTEQQKLLLKETYLKRLSIIERDIEIENQKRIAQFNQNSNLSLINAYADDIFDITKTRLSYMTEAMKKKQTGENIEETYNKSLENISTSSKDKIKALTTDITNFNIEIGNAETNIIKLNKQWDRIAYDRTIQWNKTQDENDLKVYDEALKGVSKQLRAEEQLKTELLEKIKIKWDEIDATKKLSVAQTQQANQKKQIDTDQLAREAALLEDSNAIQLRKDKIKLAEYMQDYKFYINTIKKYDKELDLEKATIEENDYKRRLELNRKIQSDFLKFGIGFFTKKTNKEIQEIIDKLKNPGTSEEIKPDQFVKEKLAEINQLKMLYEEVNTGYAMSSTGAVQKLTEDEKKKKLQEITDIENDLAKSSDSYKRQLFKNRLEDQKAKEYLAFQTEKDRLTSYHNRRMQEIQEEYDITYKGKRKGETEEQFRERQRVNTRDQALKDTFNAINNIAGSTTTTLTGLNEAFKDGKLSAEEFAQSLNNIGGVLNNLSNIKGLENLGVVGAGVQAGVGIFQLGKTLDDVISGNNEDEIKRRYENYISYITSFWEKLREVKELEKGNNEERKKSAELQKYIYDTQITQGINNYKEYQDTLNAVVDGVLNRWKETQEMINDMASQYVEILKQIVELNKYNLDVNIETYNAYWDKLIKDIGEMGDAAKLMGMDIEWLKPPTKEGWKDWFDMYLNGMKDFMNNKSNWEDKVNSAKTAFDEYSKDVWGALNPNGEAWGSLGQLGEMSGNQLENALKGDLTAITAVLSALDKMKASLEWMRDTPMAGFTDIDRQKLIDVNNIIGYFTKLKGLAQDYQNLSVGWANFKKAMEDLGSTPEEIDKMAESIATLRYNEYNALKDLGLLSDEYKGTTEEQLGLIQEAINNLADYYGVKRKIGETEDDFLRRLLVETGYNETIVGLLSQQKSLKEDLLNIEGDLGDAELERISLLEAEKALTADQAAQRRAIRLRQMIQEAMSSGKSQEYINMLYKKLAAIISGSAGDEFMAGTGGAITSFQTGSDNVPSTGLYKLHKGEIVIPPESSDRIRQLKNALNASISNSKFTGIPTPTIPNNINKSNMLSINGVSINVTGIQDLRPEPLARLIESNLKVQGSIKRIS